MYRESAKSEVNFFEVVENWVKSRPSNGLFRTVRFSWDATEHRYTVSLGVGNFSVIGYGTSAIEAWEEAYRQLKSQVL